MKNMIKISEVLEKELRGIYEDCLDLEKKDLTEHGEREMFILEMVLER